VILLDTHVLVWLYTGLLSHIPAPVQARLNLEPLGLSPFAQLELAYLYEVGRVRAPAEAVVSDLSARLELTVIDASAAALCASALAFNWTRDPFDRLLAAHATVANLPLVTKNTTLRQHLRLAWWA
jgi:PIN domain nuclease of toxin-antitoxin system